MLKQANFKAKTLGPNAIKSKIGLFPTVRKWDIDQRLSFL
jgi:hypothetical protein